jgi:hypothetical protein
MTTGMVIGTQAQLRRRAVELARGHRVRPWRRTRQLVSVTADSPTSHEWQGPARMSGESECVRVYGCTGTPVQYEQTVTTPRRTLPGPRHYPHRCPRRCCSDASRRRLRTRRARRTPCFFRFGQFTQAARLCLYRCWEARSLCRRERACVRPACTRGPGQVGR